MLGKKHGYVPEDPVEAYHVDWAIETYQDIFSSGINLNWFKESLDEEQLAKIGTQFANWNQLIEKKLSQMGTKFLAGDKITIGDFIVFSEYASVAVNDRPVREAQQAACAKALEDSPAVTAWVKAMKEELKEYLEERP